MDNIQIADSLTFIGQMELGFNKAMEEGRFRDAGTYADSLEQEWTKVAVLLRLSKNIAQP